MRAGTWTIRLDHDAASADLKSLAAFLRRELADGGVLSHIDQVALEALDAGTLPLAGFAFTLQVREGVNLHARIHFERALPGTGAVESVLGPQGFPSSFAVKEIKTVERWLASDDPNAMLQGRWQTVSPRKRRLFGCACCRVAWASLTDERSRRAVVVAEAFADGVADAVELSAAHDAANAAVRDVPREPPDSPQSLVCCAAASAANSLNASIAVSNALIEAAEGERTKSATRALHADLLRDIIGSPFSPVAVDPSWLTSTVIALARGIYEEQTFDQLPILADALEDAGCDAPEVLGHCRCSGRHARGCWVLDSLLGKD